jgi:hypothetical protein
MSGKNTIYYVNDVITSENVDELNRRFSQNEYEYKHIIFFMIVDIGNKNFKINIPLGAKSVIILSGFKDYDITHLIKIPFGCRFFQVNKSSQVKTIMKPKGKCYYKLDDLIEDYKPTTYKFINFGKKQLNTRTINNESYLVLA